MTALINQLVEEMKEMTLKYTLVELKLNCGCVPKMKKLCVSNNKKELKNKMLKLCMKKCLLREYMSMKILKECKVIYFQQYPFDYIFYRKKNGKKRKRKIDSTRIEFIDISISSNVIGIILQNNDVICYQII